jgi:hypothetical protein
MGQLSRQLHRPTAIAAPRQLVAAELRQSMRRFPVGQAHLRSPQIAEQQTRPSSGFVASEPDSTVTGSRVIFRSGSGSS